MPEVDYSTLPSFPGSLHAVQQGANKRLRINPNLEPQKATLLTALQNISPKFNETMSLIFHTDDAPEEKQLHGGLIRRMQSHEMDDAVSQAIRATLCLAVNYKRARWQHEWKAATWDPLTDGRYLELLDYASKPADIMNAVCNELTTVQDWQHYFIKCVVDEATRPGTDSLFRLKYTFPVCSTDQLQTSVLYYTSQSTVECWLKENKQRLCLLTQQLAVQVDSLKAQFLKFG